VPAHAPSAKLATWPPNTPDTLKKNPKRQWHRAFGIALMEVFAETPWAVELELEMALKSQLLDVAIIEAAESDISSQPPPDLPDGLVPLRAHNLLTYKSHHEALTAWVLDELIGHYVNYRKLKVDAKGKRHPINAFGLYAVGIPVTVYIIAIRRAPNELKVN